MALEILSNTDVSGLIIKVLFFLVLGIFGIGLLAGVGFFVYVRTFIYKMTILPLIASGREDGTKRIFTIGSPYNNKVKFDKNRSHWKKLWPLFNGKKLQPFASSEKYSGNNYFAYELDGKWIPAKVGVTPNYFGGNPHVEIQPVPHSVREWQMLEHKQIAEEFTKKTWWDENKVYFTLMVVVFCMCAMATASTYFLLQFINKNIQASTAQNADVGNTIIEYFKNNGITGGSNNGAPP